MTNTVTALGITILVLLFALVILIYNSRTTESNLITGFWRADPDFCQEAGIELFLVYFGEGSSISSVRPGYIIIKNEDGLIINNPVNFCMYGGYSIKPGLSKHREYVLNIDWLDEEGYDSFFPTEQLLTYYPDCGKLVFSLENKVYAILYKDHAISDMTRQMPDETIRSNEEITSDLTESEEI